MNHTLLRTLALRAALVGLVIITALTGSARAHAQDATPVPSPGAQVEMTDGRTLRLEGPFAVTGEWQIGELSLSSFELDHLQHIERTASGTLMLTLTDGTQAEGVAGADATLEGEGEWGREKLPFSTIQRISLEGTSPPPGLESANGSVQIETVGGLAFRLTDFDLDGEWLIGELRIVYPDYAYIQTLERTAEWTFTARAKDGATVEMHLDEWAESALLGNTAWGRARLPCSAIQRLVIEEPAYDFHPSPSVENVVAEIKTTGGQVTTLTGLDVSGKVHAAASDWEAGRFLVEHILFGALQRIERTGDRTFTVEDGEGATLDLMVDTDAALTGDTQWGWGRLPFAAVQRVTVSGAGPVSHGVRGTLALTDGSSWTIEPQSLHMAQPASRRNEVEADDRGWDMLLLAGPLEYWIGDSYWIGHGFSQQDGQVTIPCGAGPCPSGRVEDADAYLRFALTALVLRVPLSQVQQFTPSAEAAAMAAQPRWSATITGWDGHSVTFPFTQLAYTRYPDTCWTGWYASDPFTWYTDTLLPVIKPDGSRLDIDFERLSRIEWPQPYDSQRMATVVSTQGSSLAVTIYPGSTNEDTKKGPASWDSGLEGLLGTVADGYQVYIPLVNISLIELNPPTGS